MDSNGEQQRIVGNTTPYTMQEVHHADAKYYFQAIETEKHQGRVTPSTDVLVTPGSPSSTMEMEFLVTPCSTPLRKATVPKAQGGRNRKTHVATPHRYESISEVLTERASTTTGPGLSAMSPILLKAGATSNPSASTLQSSPILLKAGTNVDKSLISTVPVMLKAERETEPNANNARLIKKSFVNSFTTECSDDIIMLTIPEAISLTEQNCAGALKDQYMPHEESDMAPSPKLQGRTFPSLQPPALHTSTAMPLDLWVVRSMHNHAFPTIFYKVPQKLPCDHAYGVSGMSSNSEKALTAIKAESRMVPLLTKAGFDLQQNCRL
jgi:hypothetical protein